MLDPLLRDFPNDPRLIRLAVAYHRQCGNPGKAMMLLGQGLKHNPGDHHLCVLMADIAFTNGEYDKAITYWKRALDHSTEGWTLYNRVAEALMSSGRYREAVDTLEHHMNPSSASAQTYYLLGQGYLQLKEYETAKEHYERAFALNPYHPGLTYALAKVYTRLKQADKARQYMEAHNKRRADKDRQRQDWAMRRERPVLLGRAQAEIERFCGLLAGLCGYGSRLYQARQDFQRSGEIFRQGEQAFREAIAIVPGDADLYREFAVLYIEADREVTRASELAEQAVALEEAADNYSTLANAYHKRAELAKALAALERAMELDPQNPAYKTSYTKIRREQDGP